MTIETKFGLLDFIKIIPLGSWKGRVLAIKIDFGNTILYDVEYWIDGEVKTAWLMEDEVAHE